MATLIQKALQSKIDSREELLKRSLTASQQAVRHKCFVCYHHADENEVETFIDSFESVFIPRVLGISDEDVDLIDSTDTDYVMDQIREKYLTDSTVTIVLVGKCTWARRYVDWELYSTLRNDKHNRRSGLLAIELPSRGTGSLPPRVNDNLTRDSNGIDLGYARWNVYPGSTSSLRAWIEDAFQARTTRSNLIVNTRARKINNSSCS